MERCWVVVSQLKEINHQFIFYHPSGGPGVRYSRGRSQWPSRQQARGRSHANPPPLPLPGQSDVRGGAAPRAEADESLPAERELRRRHRGRAAGLLQELVHPAERETVHTHTR